MTVSLVGATTPKRSVPYITPDMFRLHSRAGVQTENLVKGGTPADQEAALLEFIEEAGSWVDDQAEQTFAAALDVVSGQVNVGNNGFVDIYPRYQPPIGLASFSIGPLPSDMTAMTSFSGAMVTEFGFSVPTFSGVPLTSSQGPLQFGGIGAPWDQAWCTYGYVFGYPVTYLGADVAAASTSISVADTTGMVAGQTWLKIYAGRAQVRRLVNSVSTADAGGLGFGPGVIGVDSIAAAIPNPPDIPIMVSALPPSLILANVLITRALIKGKTPSTPARGKERKTTAGDDYAEAAKIISRHRLVARS